MISTVDKCVFKVVRSLQCPAIIPGPLHAFSRMRSELCIGEQFLGAARRHLPEFPTPLEP